MRMYDIIKKKRDGEILEKPEIDFFVKGYTKGEIPDEQAAALLMAIFFKGMNTEETANLTMAIAKSGDMVDLSDIVGFKADKHSTGGVGDKTTLIVAPLVAACGVKVAKMSGRGLGHTGGTVDKLEAIPGFQTALPREKFLEVVNDVGCCVIGQSGELAPADKKLYALRDITATVDKLPLIASSIMGKKLASGDDGIVLDVKIGSGGFNKTFDEGLALAKVMVSIGNRAGKITRAVLSNMDKPLGYAVGNSLEVKESIEILRGGGDKELKELCIELAATMLTVAGKGELAECRELALQKLNNGEAFHTLRKMVKAQGGNPEYIDNPSLFRIGPEKFEVKSKKAGYITAMDTEKYGVASLLLGAGRNKKEDKIDHGAGLVVKKKTGDFVAQGDTLAVLYAATRDKFDEVEDVILEALTFGTTAPAPEPIVLGRVK